jgi:hypothetical protein
MGERTERQGEIRNQFGRRNLSPYDRSALALKLKELIRERAKERQQEHGGTAPGKNIPQKSGGSDSQYQILNRFRI